MGRTNDLLCLITLPDSYVLAIETQKSSKGLPIFDEVCRKLNILQKDFFGLQVRDDKYGTRWLNLRNTFTSEVNCSCSVKLFFSIKYYVQPHHLLQDSTRDAFFKITRNNFLLDHFNDVGDEFVNESAAILCHCSDFTAGARRDLLPSDVLPRSRSDPCRFKDVRVVADTLSVSSGSEAKRLFLNKMCHCMSTLGHRYSASLNGNRVDLCVLECGLAYVNEKLEVVSNHDWLSIQQAVHSGCEVTVHFASADQLVFTLKSKVTANAFYRDLTEVYTFFHCDTVDGIITGQTFRDFKGTIVSLFNENSSFGRAYVFDIEHTLKEMSELVRRRIYHQEKSVKQPLHWNKESDRNRTTTAGKNKSSCNCKTAEYLKELKDLFVCSLCIENALDTTFIPCGHVFCCRGCSSKVDQCPLCKEPITSVQHIYLPSISFISAS